MNRSATATLYLKSAFLFFLFAATALLIFYLPWQAMRHATLDQFNNQQKLLAGQAAKGIENFFLQYEIRMEVLAGDYSVITLDDIGKKELDDFYRLNQREISAITRISASGIIEYTAPYNSSLIGMDVSGQEHNRLIMKQHRKIVSTVFTAVQGYKAVACSVPVFNGPEYVGCLTVLIPFQQLAEKFVADIRIGEQGYAWMISREGIELYCPVPGHTGRTVVENSSDFPTVMEMADEMMAGKEGQTVYSYNFIKDTEVVTVEKEAVYFPVKLSGNHWSIVVATPTKQALAHLNSFIRLWWGLFGLLCGCFFFYTLFLVRGWLKQQEEMNRQQLEKKALDNERFLRLFINHTRLPIGIIHLDGKVEFLNTSLQQIYGYTMEDISTVDDWFRNVYKDTRKRSEIVEQWKNRMAETIKSGASTSKIARTVTCKDGTEREVVFDYTLIEDRVVITLNDVTEANRVQRAEHELRHRQAQAKKMEAIGLMAGGVAHDLNNILSGIVSYPELLLMQLPPESDLREPLEVIQQSGERAAAVVADLLTVARGVAAARDIITLNDLVEEYLHSPEFKKVKRKGVEFHTILDPELLNIKGSAVHLRKCLMNLVTNAVEAIEEGGRVTVSTSNLFQLKDEADFKAGSYVILTIADNGSGIAPEDLEHIFEPFYTKKVMGLSGTGLGLSIVWNTLDDHGGTVRVKSSHQGTIFELFLPATVEKMEDNGQVMDVNSFRGSGQFILVVDDEKNQRDIATRMLSELGYQVKSVSSGEEAIRFVRKQPVDLLLLDMIMGSGINGCTTYQQILEIYPNQKAVVATGFAHSEDVTRTLAMGAASFIKKPYSLTELSRELAVALHD